MNEYDRAMLVQPCQHGIKARIAEKELFLKDEIRQAQSAGKFEEAESLEKQLTSEIRRLQEDCEAKKEKLRASFAAK